jgi:hypothetical protein
MKDQRHAQFKSRLKLRNLYLAAILMVSFGCATGPSDSSDQSAPDDLSAEVASADSSKEVTPADPQSPESKPHEDEFLDDLNKQSGEKEAQQATPQESTQQQQEPPPVTENSQPPADPKGIRNSIGVFV